MKNKPKLVKESLNERHPSAPIPILSLKEDIKPELAEVIVTTLINRRYDFDERTCFSVFAREEIKERYAGRIPRGVASPNKCMLVGQIVRPLVGEDVYVDGGVELVKGEITVMRLDEHTTWRDVAEALNLDLDTD